MKNIETIDINIWDDFYDDGYVPEGKIQETYAYIEGCPDYVTEDDKEIIMELFLNHIKSKKSMNDVEIYQDSDQIIFKNITHKKLETLVKVLETENLVCSGVALNIYSES